MTITAAQMRTSSVTDLEREEHMTDLERFFYWTIYAAALEAKKQRKNKLVVERPAFRRDLTNAAQELGAIGMVL